MCDYTETSDATNDASAETSGLALDGPAKAICGYVNPDHYSAVLRSADDDRYRVKVTAATPALIDVTLRDQAHALTGLTLRFWSLDAQPQLVGIAIYDPTLAEHGAFSITLPPGDYDMVISGDAAASIQGTPLFYRVRFATMPDCNETADPPTYTEAQDAAGANDTVSVDFSKDPSFKPATGGAPEATAISVGAGHSYAIAGTLDATAHPDQYLDRDTYEFTTDDTANEVAVRVTWPTTTSDVDYVIFEASSMRPVVASNLASDTGPELAMFAVKPTTKYWLWIGDFKGSTATSYRATVCGNHFTR